MAQFTGSTPTVNDETFTAREAISYAKSLNKENYGFWKQSLKDSSAQELANLRATTNAYRDLGFAPSLALGNVPSPQGIGTLATPSPRDVDMSDRQAALQNAATQQAATTSAAATQAMVANSQSRLLQDQAEGQRIKNEMDQNELDDYERRRDKEFAKMDADEAVQQSVARLNNVKAEVEDLNRQLKAGELQYQPELFDRIFKKYDEEINNIKSNTNLNEETKNLRIEEINKARQETKESQARTAVQWSIKSLNEEERQKIGEEYRRLKAENDDYDKGADIRARARNLERFYQSITESPEVRKILMDTEIARLIGELQDANLDTSAIAKIVDRAIGILSPFASLASSAVRPPSVTNRYNNYTTNYR